MATYYGIVSSRNVINLNQYTRPPMDRNSTAETLSNDYRERETYIPNRHERRKVESKLRRLKKKAEKHGL